MRCLQYFKHGHVAVLSILMLLGVSALCVRADPTIKGDSPYVAFDLRGFEGDGKGVAYFDSAPVGGWPEQFKKEFLLLRKVPQDSKDCKLAEPYYIGVFEVTRFQYALVMGLDTASLRDSVLPVTDVSWNQLRSVADKGSYIEDYDWPLRQGVAEQSFFGRLRRITRHGGFDLPSEAQWTQACCWAMSEKAVAIDAEGKEVLDRSHVMGTNRLSSVGSYYPNALGLYDMFANASEWCLDRAGDDRDMTISVHGIEYGKIVEVFRVVRAGTLLTYGRWYRRKDVQHIGMPRRGFRVVLNDGPCLGQDDVRHHGGKPLTKACMLWLR